MGAGKNPGKAGKKACGVLFAALRKIRELFFFFVFRFSKNRGKSAGKRKVAGKCAWHTGRNGTENQNARGRRQCFPGESEIAGKHGGTAGKPRGHFRRESFSFSLFVFYVFHFSENRGKRGTDQ